MSVDLLLGVPLGGGTVPLRTPGTLGRGYTPLVRRNRGFNLTYLDGILGRWDDDPDMSFLPFSQIVSL